MDDVILRLNAIAKDIISYSTTVEIHTNRSKTIAQRVKTILNCIERTQVNTSNITFTPYLTMLLATLEEIFDYLKLLQSRDQMLGRRVMRFGCDEELFYKWNETLQTCSADLKLGVEDGLFDATVDSGDFDRDLEYLQSNLRDILGKVPGILSVMEEVVKANQKLLTQQQTDKTHYMTRQAVRDEKNFDPKLLRYENVIGSGGFGEVWKARYRGDFVAVKKVPSKSLSDAAKISLRREAEFMKKLSHPRIVSCFGILEAEESYCMIMELCVNGSLSVFMVTNASETVDTEKRINFAIDIATGMNYLHQLGVVHRDLKLGNVVLDEHDRAKITDFGLSVVKSNSQTSMKLDECGTPQYMAPESFGLAPVFSTKSDVYAFAIVLWELSHWKVAYDHVSILEIKDSIKNGDRLPISVDVAEETKTLIQECWRPNPRLRPTYSQILDRLLCPNGNNFIPDTQFNNTVISRTGNQKTLQSSSRKLLPDQDGPLLKKKSNLKRILIISITFLLLALIGVGVGVFVYINGRAAVSTESSIPTFASLTTAMNAPTSTSQSINPTPFATVSTLLQDNNSLWGVYGITIDENDNIYIIQGHFTSYRPIYRINYGPPVTITFIADLSNDGQGYLNDDQGICYFNNTLYVPRVGQLTKIDLSNNNAISTFAGNGTAGPIKDGNSTSAVFCGAMHCVADSLGNIYVSEICKSIRKVSQSGDVVTLTSGLADKPFGLAFNGSGKLLFTTWTPCAVYSVDLKSMGVGMLLGSSSLQVHTDGQGIDSQLGAPGGLAVDKLGNLLVVETRTNSVSIVNSTYYFSLFAGNLTTKGYTNGIGNASKFNNPRHAVFDSKGRLIVADQNNNAIRMISW